MASFERASIAKTTPEGLDAERERLWNKLSDIRRLIYESEWQDHKNDNAVNTTLEVREAGKGVSVILHHPNGGPDIDISTYLPPGFSFRFAENYQENSLHKLVTFPEKTLKYRGGLVSLFHEIGHARENAEEVYGKQGEVVVRQLGAYMQSLLKGATQLFNSSTREQDHAKALASLTGLGEASVHLPEWYKDTLVGARGKFERDAWAYALKALNDLQKKGYEVFDGFDSVDQIQRYIDRALLTYEISFLAARMSDDDPDAFAKYQGSAIRNRKGKYELNSEVATSPHSEKAE